MDSSAGVLKGVKLKGVAEPPASLPCVERPEPFVCLSFRIGTANPSLQTTPLIMSGCDLSPPHGGGSRLCKLLLTHKSSLPRIKDEDPVIPSETLGVLRLTCLRGSWAVGGFRILPLCGQGLCSHLRGNRNCDQRCDYWVFFLHCS